jgi:acid stress-induced BolA-like protein IbaG/YrbA
MAVVRKLKKILKEQFPLPDKVNLGDDDDDGVIGVVTSRRFYGMDTMQRQNLLHEILTTHLSREEQRHVLMIVAVTPEEEIANARDDDN